VAKVWQAKRYPNDINWAECKLSLVRAVALKTREGTAEFSGMTGVVAPSDMPWVAEQLQGTTHQRVVIYPLFGREISLGMGAYELPRLKVVEVIPYGVTPDAPAPLACDGVQLSTPGIGSSGSSP
jgi:hypothetical protein